MRRRSKKSRKTKPAHITRSSAEEKSIDDRSDSLAVMPTPDKKYKKNISRLSTSLPAIFAQAKGDSSIITEAIEQQAFHIARGDLSDTGKFITDLNRSLSLAEQYNKNILANLRTIFSYKPTPSVKKPLNYTLLMMFNSLQLAEASDTIKVAEERLSQDQKISDYERRIHIANIIVELTKPSEGSTSLWQQIKLALGDTKSVTDYQESLQIYTRYYMQIAFELFLIFSQETTPATLSTDKRHEINQHRLASLKAIFDLITAPFITTDKTFTQEQIAYNRYYAFFICLFIQRIKQSSKETQLKKLLHYNKELAERIDQFIEITGSATFTEKAEGMTIKQAVAGALLITKTIDRCSSRKRYDEARQNLSEYILANVIKPTQEQLATHSYHSDYATSKPAVNIRVLEYFLKVYHQLTPKKKFNDFSHDPKKFIQLTNLSIIMMQREGQTPINKVESIERIIVAMNNFALDALFKQAPLSKSKLAELIAIKNALEEAHRRFQEYEGTAKPVTTIVIDKYALLNRLFIHNIGIVTTLIYHKDVFFQTDRHKELIEPPTAIPREAKEELEEKDESDDEDTKTESDETVDSAIPEQTDLSVKFFHKVYFHIHNNQFSQAETILGRMQISEKNRHFIKVAQADLLYARAKYTAHNIKIKPPKVSRHPSIDGYTTGSMVEFLDSARSAINILFIAQHNAANALTIMQQEQINLAKALEPTSEAYKNFIDYQQQSYQKLYDVIVAKIESIETDMELITTDLARTRDAAKAARDAEDSETVYEPIRRGPSIKAQINKLNSAMLSVIRDLKQMMKVSNQADLIKTSTQAMIRSYHSQLEQFKRDIESLHEQLRETRRTYVQPSLSSSPASSSQPQPTFPGPITIDLHTIDVTQALPDPEPLSSKIAADESAIDAAEPCQIHCGEEETKSTPATVPASKAKPATEKLALLKQPLLLPRKQPAFFWTANKANKHQVLFSWMHLNQLVADNEDKHQIINRFYMPKFIALLKQQHKAQPSKMLRALIRMVQQMHQANIADLSHSTPIFLLKGLLDSVTISEAVHLTDILQYHELLTSLLELSLVKWIHDSDKQPLNLVQYQVLCRFHATITSISLQLGQHPTVIKHFRLATKIRQFRQRLAKDKATAHQLAKSDKVLLHSCNQLLDLLQLQDSSGARLRVTLSGSEQFDSLVWALITGTAKQDQQLKVIKPRRKSRSITKVTLADLQTWLPSPAESKPRPLDLNKLLELTSNLNESTISTLQELLLVHLYSLSSETQKELLIRAFTLTLGKLTLSEQAQTQEEHKATLALLSCTVMLTYHLNDITQKHLCLLASFMTINHLINRSDVLPITAAQGHAYTQFLLALVPALTARYMSHYHYEYFSFISSQLLSTDILAVTKQQLQQAQASVHAAFGAQTLQRQQLITMAMQLWINDLYAETPSIPELLTANDRLAIFTHDMLEQIYPWGRPDQTLSKTFELSSRLLARQTQNPPQSIGIQWLAQILLTESSDRDQAVFAFKHVWQTHLNWYVDPVECEHLVHILNCTIAELMVTDTTKELRQQLTTLLLEWAMQLQEPVASLDMDLTSRQLHQYGVLLLLNDDIDRKLHDATTTITDMHHWLKIFKSSIDCLTTHHLEYYQLRMLLHLTEKSSDLLASLELPLAAETDLLQQIHQLWLKVLEQWNRFETVALPVATLSQQWELANWKAYITALSDQLKFTDTKDLRTLAETSLTSTILNEFRSYCASSQDVDLAEQEILDKLRPWRPSIVTAFAHQTHYAQYARLFTQHRSAELRVTPESSTPRCQRAMTQ